MRYLLTLLVVLPFIASPSIAQYAPQFGTAVAVSKNQVIVGEGRNLLMPGSVFVYEQASDGAWAQVDELVAFDAGDEAMGFGRSIAVWENTLVAGAPTANAVYIFERNAEGMWEGTGKLTDDYTDFGSEVAIHDDHLIVAASGGREMAGKVYAFHRTSDGSWEQMGQLDAGDMTSPARYGEAIRVLNNRAVVGAPGIENRTGAVYSFFFDDETDSWQSGDSLAFGWADNNHRFGSAFYMAGSYLAVGIPGYENSTGAVALYKIDESTNTWTYDRRLTPFDAQGGEQFGTAIGYADGQLWIGAPRYGDQEGMVYRFATNSETGRMAGVQQLAPSGLQYRSNFGDALAVSADLAVLGAYGHDNFEGTAFIYTKDDEAWNLNSSVFNDSGVFATMKGDEVKCEDGRAGAFSCENVDMISFMSRSDVGAKRGMQVNDVWGWEDPETGREYAIIGRTDGTSFIDLTNPSMPVYLGNLSLTEGAHQSIWRDMKVYKDHAFIVSDGAGPHHMQVFDLRQLRDIEQAPVEFTETAIYKGIYSSHNIIINEETGFAYAVGSDSGGETCGGALHMINIQDPTNPTFAGCFADDRTGRGGSGATHDAQCVIYRGPDVRYQGQEICLSSNGTALSIADVTDKENPIAISIAEYPNTAYTHQGWLDDEHRYFYLNDEGDEVTNLVDATRTMIFDLTELDDPVAVGEYLGPDNAIDHNLYIKGNIMYQTNYISGLRIIDITNRESPTEVGHFDTVPYGKNDNSPVLGAWSNYPYFKSGIIVVTSGREGIFFLKKTDVDI